MLRERERIEFARLGAVFHLLLHSLKHNLISTLLPRPDDANLVAEPRARRPRHQNQNGKWKREKEKEKEKEKWEKAKEKAIWTARLCIYI
jgi:hypothetical protein